MGWWGVLLRNLRRARRAPMRPVWTTVEGRWSQGTALMGKMGLWGSVADERAEDTRGTNDPDSVDGGRPVVLARGVRRGPRHCDDGAATSTGDRRADQGPCEAENLRSWEAINGYEPVNNDGSNKANLVEERNLTNGDLETANLRPANLAKDGNGNAQVPGGKLAGTGVNEARRKETAPRADTTTDGQLQGG
ncbi:hypothetical protein HN51_058236, partial [Arachis hypogaea]